MYLTYCKNGTLYVGCTNNVNRRLEQHNAGKGGEYTRRNIPLVLVATWAFETLPEARQLERDLKKQPHEDKLLIAKRTGKLELELDA